MNDTFLLDTTRTPFYYHNNYAENMILSVIIEDIYMRIIECREDETVNLYRIEYREIDTYTRVSYDKNAARYTLSSAVSFIIEYLETQDIGTQRQVKTIYYKAIRAFKLDLTPITLIENDVPYETESEDIRMSYMVGITAKYLYCIEGSGLKRYNRKWYDFNTVKR